MVEGEHLCIVFPNSCVVSKILGKCKKKVFQFLFSVFFFYNIDRKIKLFIKLSIVTLIKTLRNCTLLVILYQSVSQLSPVHRVRISAILRALQKNSGFLECIQSIPINSISSQILFMKSKVIHDYGSFSKMCFCWVSCICRISAVKTNDP